jgi:pimeloyl-ACP methyl ester carboxylesterase
MSTQAQSPTETPIAGWEAAQIDRANAAGTQPVLFVHGLWLLSSSWERWASLFEQAGFVAVTPGWPDDPQTVEEALANLEVFARKSLGQVADHIQAVAERLDRKPAIVGHSFGGLIAEIVAGRGLAAASVAISPAPFRGVLALPISALRSAAGVIANPLNRHRAVPLTFDQFRYAFANAVSEDEARQLYDTYSVPGPGEPVFQAADENLNPWSEAKVDTDNPDRGPLLIIGAGQDHTAPWAIADASYKRQRHNPGITEIVKLEARGHALTIDHGWQDVAETALAFLTRVLTVDPTDL